MAAVALVATTGGVFAGRAGAVPTPAGAAITLDRTSVQVGQRVLVTLSGWHSRNVTVSVCGNLARRGSGDCNLDASQGLKLVAEPTVTELTVFAPPGTCPCVIRASSAQQDEVAVAPIQIAGVPTGPVIGPDYSEPVDLTVGVRAVRVGFLDALRETLGGPVAYEVTVSVRNLTTDPINGLAVTGSVGHAENDSVASFDVPPPGPIPGGQTWTHSVRVKVPAPVINRFVWQVTASGAGAPATAETTTHRVPIGFVVLGVLLVVDVVAMVWYFTARRLRRRRGGPVPDPADALPRWAAAPASEPVGHGA